jgi:hypothetical protein
LSQTEATASRVIHARRGYVWLAWLFAACVVVQVFLLGLELFDASAPATLHRDFAYLYGWLLPGMLLLARIGRLAAGMLVLTAFLLVLYAVQTVMPALASGLPLLGPLHAINALVLFGLGIFLARRGARYLTRGPESGNA